MLRRAGIAGSLLFSRFYDGHRALFARVMTAGIALALALLVPAAGSVGALFAVCALWGLAATAFNVAFQAEVIRVTDADSAAVAMSIFSGLFNLGIGAGSLAGGMVVTAAGVGAVAPVGALVAACGALCCIVFMRRCSSIAVRSSTTSARA